MKKQGVYDVVVVGTGNAALSAAVSASENGSKVLMVEKGPEHKRGGNSFFTDGAIRFAYGNLKSFQKVVDSLTDDEAKNIEMPQYENEEFMEDMKRVTQDKTNPELAEHLVTKSYETILWMKEQGLEFELNENQFFEKNGKKTF